MKSNFKTLLVLMMVTVMLLAGAQWAMAEANPTDVPPTHWAYKAVKALIDKGYLQLYQDQTFQGDKPVDRYTLAVIVAKILNEISAGQVGTSKEDVTLLKSLTNEFRDELVGANTKLNTTDKKIEFLARQDLIVKEDLTRTNMSVQNLTDEQKELQQEVQKMLADIGNLQEQNTRLQADIERLKVELEETKKKQNLYILAALILGLIGAAK